MAKQIQTPDVEITRSRIQRQGQAQAVTGGGSGLAKFLSSLGSTVGAAMQEQERQELKTYADKVKAIFAGQSAEEAAKYYKTNRAQYTGQFLVALDKQYGISKAYRRLNDLQRRIAAGEIDITEQGALEAEIAKARTSDLENGSNFMVSGYDGAMSKAAQLLLSKAAVEQGDARLQQRNEQFVSIGMGIVNRGGTPEEFWAAANEQSVVLGIKNPMKDKLVVATLENLAANGYDKAVEAIINYKRGDVGSLLDNPRYSKKVATIITTAKARSQAQWTEKNKKNIVDSITAANNGRLDEVDRDFLERAFTPIQIAMLWRRNKEAQERNLRTANLEFQASVFRAANEGTLFREGDTADSAYKRLAPLIGVEAARAAVWKNEEYTFKEAEKQQFQNNVTAFIEFGEATPELMQDPRFKKEQERQLNDRVVADLKFISEGADPAKTFTVAYIGSHGQVPKNMGSMMGQLRSIALGTGADDDPQAAASAMTQLSVLVAAVRAANPVAYGDLPKDMIADVRTHELNINNLGMSPPASLKLIRQRRSNPEFAAFAKRLATDVSTQVMDALSDGGLFSLAAIRQFVENRTISSGEIDADILKHDAIEYFESVNLKVNGNLVDVRGAVINDGSGQRVLNKSDLYLTIGTVLNKLRSDMPNLYGGLTKDKLVFMRTPDMGNNIQMYVKNGSERIPEEINLGSNIGIVRNGRITTVQIEKIIQAARKDKRYDVGNVIRDLEQRDRNDLIRSMR